MVPVAGFWQIFFIFEGYAKQCSMTLKEDTIFIIVHVIATKKFFVRSYNHEML